MTLLAACDGGLSSNGSLEAMDDPDGQVVVCSPPQDGTGLAVFALTDFEVTGSQDVIVTDVSLVEAENLVLVGFDFADPTANPQYRYVGNEYEIEGPDGVPETFLLESGHTYTVKVGVRADPEGGTTEGVAIEYQLDGSTGKTYTERTNGTRLVVASESEPCQEG